MQRVAADHALLADDLAAHLLDANMPARPQSLNDRRFVRTGTTGNDVIVRLRRHPLAYSNLRNAPTGEKRRLDRARDQGRFIG